MYRGGGLIGKTDLSDKRHLINKQPPQTETPGPRHFRLLSPSAIWRRNTSCLSSLPEDGRNTFQSFYEARDTLNQKIHKSTPRKENCKFPPLFFHYSYGVRGERVEGAHACWRAKVRADFQGVSRDHSLSYGLETGHFTGRSSFLRWLSRWLLGSTYLLRSWVTAAHGHAWLLV